MDQTPVDSSTDAPGNRRDLPALQTSFQRSSTRLQRPRPSESMLTYRSEDGTPLQPPAVRRRDSKSSIRALFTRSKSTRMADNDANLQVVQESEGAAEPPSIGGTPLSPANTRTAKSSTPVPSLNSPTSSQLKHKPSKGAVRSKSTKNCRPLRPITAWDPPPLFQAYPQAVKHASLQASTLSAETILRLNNPRRRGSIKEETVTNLESLEMVRPTHKKESEDKEKKHNRKISGSISRADWTQKVYVLVTSGYLLQYAGEGHFDRLPEKMMQLGKDSVAFASDAIPGKHWVLQISQTSTDDGEVAVDATRNLFSRLGFRSADARRAARNFLLILGSPEELDSWLITVRREIEALGGRKCRPDSPAPEEPASTLQSRLSQRYLVKRDPNQFSNVPSAEKAAKTRSQAFSFAESENIPVDIESRASTELTSAHSVHGQALSTKSTEALSLSTTGTTTDLDRLRENSRFSYVSTGSRTMPSSRGSSAPSSPIKETFSLPDLPPFDTTIVTSPNLASLSGSAKRHSTHAPSPLDSKRKSVELKASAQSPRPSSAFGTSNMGSASPGAPNFSLPTFSKRYSVNASQIPPLPTPPRTASTIQPSPSPSPPTVEDASQQSKGPKSERPISILGDLPELSATVAAPAPSSRRNSARPSSAHGEKSPHPKRLSSLEYSKGIDPLVQKRLSAHAQPPHPPPDMALPELPTRPTSAHSNPKSFAFSFQPQNKTLRRPVSMQVQTDPLPVPRPQRSPSVASPTALHYTTESSPARSSFQATRLSVSNSIMIAASTGSNPGTKLVPRASMPDLSLGPPAAPPPDCPLPEVPPIIVSRLPSPYRKSGANGPVSTSKRNSIDRRTGSTRTRLGAGWTNSTQALSRVSVL